MQIGICRMLVLRHRYLHQLSVNNIDKPSFTRSFSSRWKAQRDSDIYAERAISEGMRSRAAYKLDEIDQKFQHFLRPGANVIDLGAAPGGFSMVAAKRIRIDDAINRWNSVSKLNEARAALDTERTLGGSQGKRKFGKLLCIDRDEMKPIAGAIFIKGDIFESRTHALIQRVLSSEEADVVLCDMAPNTTGEKETNHIRIMELVEEAYTVAQQLLCNGGTFVCKIFSGSEEKEFKESLRENFVKVGAFRPKASRKISPEIYYIAQGFVPNHLRVQRLRERTSMFDQVEEHFDRREEREKDAQTSNTPS